MKRLHLDFETFSEVDIRKVGTYRYATHASTEALMLGWQLDEGMTHLWDITLDPEMPKRLEIALENPTVEIHAFNATFERLILKYCLKVEIPIERFWCTMCRAYSLAFTKGLDEVLKQCLPGHQKDPRGKKLINRFSKLQPKNQIVERWTRRNDPKGWEEFKEYCRKDVQEEKALLAYLEDYPYDQNEHEMYVLDQIINDRGVPVDPILIESAIEIDRVEKGILTQELKELTGLQNPNSKQQMKAYLETIGVPLENMQKDTIEKSLNTLNNRILLGYTTPEAGEFQRKVLSKQQQLSKTSVSKWSAFDKCRMVDNRLRGMFQFVGAQRTGRWAGRLVQLHNLPRGGNTTWDARPLAENMISLGHDGIKLLYGNPLGALSDSIRCAITAPPEKVFNVSDLSSIESRILGWIANCLTIMNIFAQGKDTYKVFATELYKIPYDEVTKPQRDFSKPPVLGGGYRLSGKGLVAYAAAMGITMTEEEGDESIRIFREVLFPEIPEFWNWCKTATHTTALTGVTVEGPHGLRTERYKDFLLLFLPSGRHIAYHKPRIEPRRAPWGEMVDSFTFMGTHKITTKWVRISAHDGFITENIVQAIARDILAMWMQRIHESGYNLIGHVHDEVICEEDGDYLDQINTLIREPIPWAPGLLLDADGMTTKRYVKG